MSVTPVFRAATPDDSSHLAILIDAASRRLTSWLWSGMAAAGQSWIEVGRERIRTNTAGSSYYAGWHIAEVEGRVAGALNCYAIPKPYDRGKLADLPHSIHAIIELEEVAEGTWYVQVASAFPEFRGLGVGTALLAKAEVLARAARFTRLTLIVESFNEGAHRLYLRLGFRELQRRPFIPFPGSGESGEWVLMVKDLE